MGFPHDAQVQDRGLLIAFRVDRMLGKVFQKKGRGIFRGTLDDLSGWCREKDRPDGQLPGGGWEALQGQARVDLCWGWFGGGKCRCGKEHHQKQAHPRAGSLPHSSCPRRPTSRRETIRRTTLPTSKSTTPSSSTSGLKVLTCSPCELRT